MAACQPHPSSAAISLTARALPARRVAHRAAREVMRALGGAMAGSWSVNVRTAHVSPGQRQRRFFHLNRTGRPNAGKSASATGLDPCAHTGPPQPPQHGRPTNPTSITSGPPPRPRTSRTATPGPSPTINSSARVRPTATGILPNRGYKAPPILGDPSLRHSDPHRPTPRANAKRQFEGMWSYERGDMGHDAQLCGYLIVEEPYVHILATGFGWDPDIDPGLRRNEADGSLVYYWVLLPRSGTRYDPRTRSLWVWDEGPMTDGDHVSVGGSQEGSTSIPGNFHRDKSWLATGMRLAERPC